MNSAKPPRLAAWILQEFGPELNQEALSGDLNEAFQQGRSKGWYWHQVLAAVQWRRLLHLLLLSILLAWWITFDWSASPLVFRPVLMAVLAATYFASLFVPSMMQRRLRILLVLLIVAIFALLLCYQRDLANHYWVFFWLVASNFLFYSERPARGPYRLTIRELVYGAPTAERQRLREKLHLALLQETDPEVRRAYSESIAALNRQLPPAKTAE